MIRLLAAFALAGFLAASRGAEEPDPADEGRCYRLFTYPLPDRVPLQAVGLAALPDGRLAAACLSGEVWILENPLEESSRPRDYAWTRFAAGLDGPRGLAWHEGALHVTQRGEVTRLEDRDGDGVADAYLAVASGWEVTGRPGEHSAGPAFDARGWLHLALEEAAEGSGGEQGRALAFPPGAQAPRDRGAAPRGLAGLGVSPRGEVFATGRAGEEGLGLLASLDGGEGGGEAAVWFPREGPGAEPTALAWDETGGGFGPFAGQMFVGEHAGASLGRVILETVDGKVQGACLPFRSGLLCAARSLAFLADGSLAIGQAREGRASRGTRDRGLQRLLWTGVTPFELLEMETRPEGYRLTFTKPLERAAAASLLSYRLTRLARPGPGGETNRGEGREDEDVAVEAVSVSEDGLTVELSCPALRPGACHELRMSGLWSAEGEPLLHPVAWHTLRAMPRE